MRLRIVAKGREGFFVPYNYQYQLHAAIYGLIARSSEKYARFLHDTGFIDENKNLKLFTFSKLMMPNRTPNKNGFSDVKQIELMFSTPIEKSMEHLVLGIFSEQLLELNFRSNKAVYHIEHVESLPLISFSEQMKFVCLSPIAVSGKSEQFTGKHYLDYTKPEEREQFITQLKKNLFRKYRMVNNKEYEGNDDFEFNFDLNYLIKKKGKISKNIRFKQEQSTGKAIYIRAMEAPFTIKADPELIKIGYECGFGENNSAGFGMVEAAKLS